MINIKHTQRSIKVTNDFLFILFINLIVYITVPMTTYAETVANVSANMVTDEPKSVSINEIDKFPANDSNKTPSIESNEVQIEGEVGETVEESEKQADEEKIEENSGGLIGNGNEVVDGVVEPLEVLKFYTNDKHVYYLESEEEVKAFLNENDNKKVLLLLKRHLPESIIIFDESGKEKEVKVSWELMGEDSDVLTRTSDNTFRFMPIVDEMDNVEIYENSKMEDKFCACVFINMEMINTSTSYAIETERYLYISTVADLVEVSIRVNAGNDLRGKTVYIDKDIDLKDVEWTPIGSQKHPFRGNIKGNGHIIKNLRSSSQMNASFIGYYEPVINSYINGVNLENVTVYGQVASGMISQVNFNQIGSSLTIKNCQVTGEVVGSDATVVGGLIAVVNQDVDSHISLENCESDVNINVEKSGCIAGGLIGKFSTSSGCKGDVNLYQCGSSGMVTSWTSNWGYSTAVSGGLIGQVWGNNVHISESFNHGTVKCTAYYAYAGGFIGDLLLDNTTQFHIDNSYVNAAVTSVCTNGASQVGGFIGHTFGDTAQKIEIIKCYASGNLSAQNRAAFSCWQENNTEIAIENSYFDKQAFQLAENQFSCKLSAFTTVWLTAKLYKSIGLNTSDMKNSANYDGWDGGVIWGISDKINNGYPYLQWKYGKEGAWTESEVTDEDFAVIEAVKKYTSGALYENAQEIINSNASDEIKYKLLTQLYNEYGLPNIKEGTEYIKNVTNERWAFIGLTTDEMYAAHNYLDYLDNTVAGNAARAALFLDGLIFNWEIGDWIDISTYLKGDYPGIDKYKDLLLSVMNYSKKDIEVLSYTNQVDEVLSNLLKIYKIKKDSDMENMLRQIQKTNSIEDCSDLTIEFVNKFIIPQVGNDITLQSEMLQEAMDLKSDTFKIVNFSFENILDFINASSRIELCHEYQRFLEEVAGAGERLPSEMVMAAAILLHEMETGYMQVFANSLVSAFFLVDDLGEEIYSIDKVILGEIGKGVLDTVELGAWIVNSFVDIGNLEKQSTQVQGFAYLADFYKDNLFENQKNFLKDMSKENAWDVYYAYTMLYKMRILGEESYIKMCDLKGLVGKLVQHGYDVETKKEVAQQTIKTLTDKMKFSFDTLVIIPDQYQYPQKIVVSCPVDVLLYDNQNNLVATLTDGTESELKNLHGKFYCYYSAYEGDFVKVMYIKNDFDYKIELRGTSQGRFSYSMTRRKEDNDYIIYKVQDCPIDKGQIAYTNTNIKMPPTIQLDYDNDGIYEKSILLLEENEDNYVKVSEINFEMPEIYMQPGAKATIPIEILPFNATHKDMMWLSSNKDVVAVNRNYIEAIEYGIADVMVYSCDSRDVMAKIKVIVGENKIDLGILNSENSSGLSLADSLQAPELILKQDDFKFNKNRNEKFENYHIVNETAQDKDSREPVMGAQGSGEEDNVGKEHIEIIEDEEQRTEISKENMNGKARRGRWYFILILFIIVFLLIVFTLIIRKRQRNKS